MIRIEDQETAPLSAPLTNFDPRRTQRLITVAEIQTLYRGHGGNRIHNRTTIIESRERDRREALNRNAVIRSNHQKPERVTRVLPRIAKRSLWRSIMDL